MSAALRIFPRRPPVIYTRNFSTAKRVSLGGSSLFSFIKTVASRPLDRLSDERDEGKSTGNRRHAKEAYAPLRTTSSRPNANGRYRLDIVFPCGAIPPAMTFRKTIISVGRETTKRRRRHRYRYPFRR